jgi:sulfide:quinone oxidoreductase
MAPLEITFMLHDYFKERGIADKVKLHYTYPINRVHSLENVAKWAAPEFDRLGIKYETFFNIKEVDGAKKVLRSEEGSEVPYDLLIAIPAHRGMEVIEKNGLGQNGWIPTNKTNSTWRGAPTSTSSATPPTFPSARPVPPRTSKPKPWARTSPRW